MWNSQTILLALIRKGLTREAAYELSSAIAMKTWQAKHAGDTDADFKTQLPERPPGRGQISFPRRARQNFATDFHFKQIKSSSRSLVVGDWVSLKIQVPGSVSC